MKKIALILIFFLSFLRADEIRAYKIDNKITSKGSVKIIETINYYFSSPHHGIFRDIPLLMRVHGRFQKVNFKLDYILLNEESVNYKKSIKNINGVKSIHLKIGSKDKLISGLQRYTIAYSLDNIVIKECQEGKDCISLNSVGTSWQVPIKNIEANYYLPEILSGQMQVKSYTGAFGSKDSKAKLEWIDSSFLRVRVNSLKAYEGLTTTFIYPSGLIKSSYLNSFSNYLYIPFFLALFAYLYKLFKKFRGFEDKRSIAPMYAPPKDISVLESGLILDTNADNKDYAAAIIELATKGYLKIHKSKDSTILEKIKKDTSPLRKDLKRFYELLFKYERDKFILDKSQSKAEELQDIFKKVNETLYEDSVQRKFFKEEPQKSKKRFLIKAAITALPFFVYAIYYVISNYGVDSAIVLIFPFVFTTVAISIFSSAKGIFEKFIALIFFAIGGLMPLYGHFGSIEAILELLIGPVGFSFAILIFIIFSYSKIGKYTQKGAYLKSYLLGLKEFISRVKRDEIKRRLKSDPLYLEKLLPYAILFGVNKHWIELFTEFNIPAPTWYDGDINDLGSFEREFNAVSNYSTNSNSNSGFSGGGFSSGGGAGGGGGGSW